MGPHRPASSFYRRDIRILEWERDGISKIPMWDKKHWLLELITFTKKKKKILSREHEKQKSYHVGAQVLKQRHIALGISAGHA